MTKVCNLIITAIFFIIMSCFLITLIKYNNTNIDFNNFNKYSTSCSIKENFNSEEIPNKKVFNKNCELDESNKCIRNRIIDKNNISGGQGMYVNIDGMELVDNQKLNKKWSKKGCGYRDQFSVFNMPECYLDKHKIEFSDNIKDAKRVAKSLQIHCPNQKYSDNNYYNKLMKKKKLSKKRKIKRILANKNQQNRINFNLNNVDFKTAEQYYKNNYGYDITPLNTDEWWLPSNFVNYSEYNRPKLDKVIVNNKNGSRAFNWHFGKTN